MGLMSNYYVPYIASHSPTQASRIGPTMQQLLTNTSQYSTSLFKSMLSHKSETIWVNTIFYTALECIVILYCNIWLDFGVKGIIGNKCLGFYKDKYGVLFRSCLAVSQIINRLSYTTSLHICRCLFNFTTN